MPPYRSRLESRRRRRRPRPRDPSARSRQRSLEEVNMKEAASAQTDGPIGTFNPLCVKEHVTCMQNQQEAASIIATSSSSLGTQTIDPDDTDTSPRTEHCISLSPMTCVLARTEIKWTYYIRLDRQGSFHTYPDLGGPYQSLQEAEKAIGRHLEGRWHPKMKQDDVSPFDMCIRRGLYWPDGTSKRRSKSRGLEDGRDKMRRLILALLDKYNEDNNLVEDHAYELKGVSNFQSICEECTVYYHLNFIITSKADGDLEAFAEVKSLKQSKHSEMVLCCFRMVDPIDKGQHCNGCTLIGNADMKHPNSSVQLAAGHSDPRYQCCALVRGESDSEDENTFLKAKEAELRRMYKGLEDPDAMERLFKRYSGTPGVLPSD